MTASLGNWADVGLPVFNDSATIVDNLEAMDDYLSSLLREYSSNKQEIMSLQLRAELAKSSEERQALVDSAWDRVRSLPISADLIAGGPKYKVFGRRYMTALHAMRQSLLPEKAVQDG
jgi:hypothetical protein